MQFLRGVIDSKVSHLVQEIENRKSRRLAPPGSAEEGAAAHGAAGREPDPVGLVQNREAAEGFRSLVLKAIAGDDLAYRVFECLAAEYTRPSEMAELLDVPVADVNNAQKRLRRKVSELLKAQRKGDRRG